MRTVGLLGGMSWQSTLLYYELVNRGVQNRLGGLHSAKILLVSFDFEEIARLQKKNDWVSLKNIFLEKSKVLVDGGAHGIVICTNTMHKLVAQLEPHIRIPYLHIVDALAEKLISKKIKKVALMGTKFVMQENFYKQKLQDRGQFSIFTPKESEQEIVHEIIFKELCQGEIKTVSQEKYLAIVSEMHSRHGIEGLVLGCTEICLLIKQENLPIPIFDTTAIHCERIADWAVTSS